MSNNSFKLTGPLFNGQASSALRGIGRDVEAGIGKRAVSLITDELHSVIKHGTGHYESKITTMQANDATVVTDGGAVQGPWLEGTSTRNKTTRFKGYSTFRRMMARVNNESKDIADAIIKDKLGGLQ